MKRAFLFVLAAIAVLALLSLVPLPFARETRIVDSVTLPSPPQKVYDFVTTPQHWPQWHPSSLGVQGATDHPLHIGEEVAEEFRLAGRHGIIHWTVTQDDAPREWRVDGEVNRRHSGAVHYRLTPDGSGTKFERAVTYRTPNLLFMILDPVFIGPRMRRESTQAIEHLAQVFAGTQGPAAPTTASEATAPPQAASEGSAAAPATGATPASTAPASTHLPLAPAPASSATGAHLQAGTNAFGLKLRSDK